MNLIQIDVIDNSDSCHYNLINYKITSGLTTQYGYKIMTQKNVEKWIVKKYCRLGI